VSIGGRIKVLVIDRTRMPFLKEAQDLYLKRLSHYTKLDWIEIKPLAHKSWSVQMILSQEARLIKKRIAPGDYVIALDREGKTYTSEDFASHLHDLIQVSRPLVFIVGGPSGIDQRLLLDANETLSLSTMTLTHEWSRVMLLEQLYRGFTIIRGESYHK